MFEINGIGGTNKPARVEREEIRRRAEVNANPTAQADAQDQVKISSEARMASNIVQFKEAVNSLPDIRQERVEAARQNLERGSYRNREVVQAVAERLSKYVV
ncbi:MAG: flagellar biosynthesis anti-sigma factor FlgM [FCB group bacterium]|jgi:flagellar biosynthesis anti-sigma factor FlgM|nr:flagellar biosynthesis anti-sigma factor FlgM [FCB group bacterium]